MAERHTDEVFEYGDEQHQADDDDDDESLKEFFDAFAEKDAILEPSISKTFEEFLDNDGDEEKGIQCLAGSYVGLPNMVNVMIEWLHAAGFRKREIQSIVEEHLKSLIMKHFDPKKADLIFTEEGSTPSWLEEMIQYTSWRELFYQLAEQYPDCIMLKFTLKLISDAGFQGEITSASTAIHQPDAFSGLIRNVLTKIASCKPADVHRCMRELTNLVIHNQQTYLYSQVVLHSLNSTESLRNLQLWVREELQRDAQGRNHNVTNMSLYFRGVGSHDKLFEALAAMLSRNALNPADMSILYKHYADERNPPPVHYIHVPQLLELLIQAFFKPGSSINPDHRDKYIFVLAYCVCVYEHPLTGEPCLDDLEATRKAIETSHLICSRANASHAELQVEVPTLFECVKYPVVSVGVVRWVEHTLLDPMFFEEAAESSSLFLVLLDEVAACHPLHHPFVLELLKKLTEGSYPMLEVSVQMELKKSLVDHLVHLLSCGHVLPVVQYIAQCMETGALDQSHIRHFVSEVLAIVGSPYSTEFSSAFLPLVQNQEITAPLTNADRTDPVSVFVAECSRKYKKKKKTKQ